MDVQRSDTFAAVHEDMLKLLGWVIDQVEAAIADNTVIKEDGQSHLKLLRDERVAAERLELRMPIIAPMKAGKSTLISAIVGTDIMPARALAMTSLPTQIVPLQGREFSLQLPTETFDYFTRLTTQLFKRLADADLGQLCGANPQLAELIRRLVDGQVKVAARVDGRQAAQQALTELNDLVRIASVAGLPEDVTGDLPAPPVLTTPLIGPGAAGGSSDRGVLTIIDTPGPDEHGMAMRLTQTVAAELSRSHVILLLLDYTHMGTEADAKVYELAKPVLGTLGADKLYVVVNKIDARGGDDMDTAKIVQFAANLLDVPKDRASDRVFETSAVRGLAASQVLAAIDAGITREQIQDHPAFSFFANQLNATASYRSFLFAGSVDDWRANAEELWRESGLPRLLDHAVGDLRAHAAPTVLSSVKTKLDGVLAGLIDSARLRIRAGEADRAKVASELSSLKHEMQKLGLRRSNVKKPEQLRKDLDRHLSGHMKACETEAQKLIRRIGDDFETDSRDEGVLGTLKRVLKGRPKRGAEVYAFTDEAEAKEAIDKIAGVSTEEVRSLLDTTRNAIVRSSAEWAHDQMVVQENIVRPILEAATKRLAATFDLDLRLPPPEFRAKQLEAAMLSPDVDEQQVTKMRIEEKEVRLARYLWFKKGIKRREIPYNVTERTYLVSIAEVRESIKASFSEALVHLKEEMHEYVSTDVTAQIDDYYQRMDNFLSQYQRSMEQSQQDWSAGDHEREQINNRLTSLVHTMEGHRSTLNELSDRLQLDTRR